MSEANQAPGSTEVFSLIRDSIRVSYYSDRSVQLAFSIWTSQQFASIGAIIRPTIEDYDALSVFFSECAQKARKP